MPTPPTPATFSTGEQLTAAKLNQVSQVVTWLTSGMPDLRVHATTTQAMAASTWTDIITFAVDYDTESGWNAAAQSYTVAVTGIYVLQASVAWAINTSSNFSQRVRILNNGNQLSLATTSLPHAGYATDAGVTTSGVYPLTAGDVLKVQGWQGSASSVNTAANFSSGANETSFFDVACIRTGAP